MTMILHIQNSTPEQRGHGRLGESGGFGMPRRRRALVPGLVHCKAWISFK
jgi:hypothetical protein